MAKLYPPIVEGTIPAFTGATLVVPFSMNRAVGASEVQNLVVKIKRINNNDIILTKEANHFDVYNNCRATFILTEEERKLFNMGQFYRLQLAYTAPDGVVGYYSSVGVIKYTAQPTVEIVGLDPLNSNLHIYEYTGRYYQTNDLSERLYSSRFQIFDKDNNLIEDSGELIHNSSLDIITNESLESFSFYQDLEENSLYHLVLTVTTTNGLIIQSPRYRLVQRDNMDAHFDELGKIRLKTTVDFEEGLCKIQLRPAVFDYSSITGVFVLFRSEYKRPYVWEKICQFSARMEPIDQIYKIDTTVQQGKTYIYSLQQKNNNNIYSRRLMSTPVTVDFEDMFLMDDKKSLKIRFNPKVTSFKEVLSEAKVNTIGSQFPYFTRNAHVQYKEFSISGLVSHLMDNNKRFMSWKEIGLEQYETNLITENIHGERVFKLEVLRWLNDGKPKIFKSPTEGNYIVRLTNVNLSPNDTLGRMLHTFSCTAVEVAPFDYKHLLYYNFVNMEATMSNVAKISSIPFAYRDSSNKLIYRRGELLKGQELYSVEVTGLLPNDYFWMNDEKFVVGATGAYKASVTTPIYSFRLPDNARYGTGVLTGEFRGLLESDFDKIKKIRMVENPALQFIGNSYWRNKNNPPVFINIIDSLADVKTKVVSIPKVRFYKREIGRIFVRHDGDDGVFDVNSKFYATDSSIDSSNLIDLNSLDKLSLYEVYYSKVGCTITDELGQKIYHYNGVSFPPYTKKYYDPTYGFIDDKLSVFDINVNNKYINLKETEEMEVKYVDYSYLEIGDGIIAELSVIQQVIDYAYEFEEASLKGLRKDYDDAYNLYMKEVVNPDCKPEDLEDYYNEVKITYAKLIDKLTEFILLLHLSKEV